MPRGHLGAEPTQALSFLVGPPSSGAGSSRPPVTHVRVCACVCAVCGTGIPLGAFPLGYPTLFILRQILDKMLRPSLNLNPPASASQRAPLSSEFTLAPLFHIALLVSSSPGPSGAAATGVYPGDRRMPSPLTLALPQLVPSLVTRSSWAPCPTGPSL